MIYTWGAQSGIFEDLLVELYHGVGIVQLQVFQVLFLLLDQRVYPDLICSAYLYAVQSVPHVYKLLYIGDPKWNGSGGWVLVRRLDSQYDCCYCYKYFLTHSEGKFQSPVP